MCKHHSVTTTFDKPPTKDHSHCMTTQRASRRRTNKIILSVFLGFASAIAVVAGVTGCSTKDATQTVFGYTQNANPDYASFGQAEVGALGFPSYVVTGNEPSLRLTADKLCEALRKGVSRQDAASSLVGATDNVGSVQANEVVDAAVQYVCSGR